MASVPTIKQVAARAGVSTATVSRVLAGATGVSDELVTRVREAVQALDYHPNRVARNLRVRTTRTIGVVISDIQNPFFTSVVRGIEAVLQHADYTLLLGNSDEDPARERLYLATLRAEGVAGMIVTPSSTVPGSCAAIAGLGVPAVIIDRVPPDAPLDSVSVANVAGARTAIAHLIELGHRRIGLIGGMPHLSTALDRRIGYEQALAEAGLPVVEELIEQADFRQQGGYTAMLALLDRARPPTAVFVANNLMTLGALQAIHERDLRIPDDIAIVGFDDMPWATSFQPPVTAVAQPTYQLGSIAARLLLERLGNPDLPVRRVVLDPVLMVRASSAGRGDRASQKHPPDGQGG